MEATTFTEEATDKMLTFIANDRWFFDEITRLARMGMRQCETVADLVAYDTLNEQALLKLSQETAAWMDDPACDLADYLLNPAEINWGAIWMHFEPTAS